ncbi:MAG: SHOCT domain-containing protein [Bacteroidales bacterium]
MFDLLFFIAIIPIIIIVLVIILVFILRNRKKSKYPQQSNISNKDYDYTSCNQSNGKSTVKQLLDLKKLYDADILTEEEFNEQKNKILNS